MIPFDFQLRTRIVFGPGSVTRLGELAGQWGVRRAMLVSDPGIILAGHADRGTASLREAGIETFVFDEVSENPTTENVEQGVRFARRHDPELIVGLGGGSSMDCAKGVNFILTNGGEMRDYWGIGKALKPMLPMIAVPTTAGTGSETQSFALISDAKTHAKMACGDPKAAFRAAILDPELTVSQPRRLTALTGIDAMAHAVETFVTSKRNEISLLYSRAAWRLLSENFLRVLAAPDDLEARGAMQLGASLAGLAIENSMLGIAHSLANPLTAHFDIVHGQAVGTMLPHVIRYNAATCAAAYAELASLSAMTRTVDDQQIAVERLASFFEQCVQRAELARTLQELQVPRESLGRLAAEAAEQWTANFNPRKATADDLRSLYEAAFA